jgi:two-component system, NtrC family, nitrogen regulation sensor histidine kinase NtrY
VTFRTKLFVVFLLALLLAVGLLAFGVTALTRRTFDQLNHQRTDAAVAQYFREFERREAEVSHQVQEIADAEGTVRMAIDLSRPQSDVSIYVNDARGVAQSHQLDFLEFVSSDGSIISSAEWSARSGYKLSWVTQPIDWAALNSFLMKVDTPSGPELGVISVSTVRVGDKNLYVVGGERLDKSFLSSVILLPGMRGLLYSNLSPTFQASNLVDAAAPLPQADRFAPYIDKERAQPARQRFEILWKRDAASAEEFQALPLLGRQQDLLGVILVGSSKAEEITLGRRIRLLSYGVMAVGVLLGFLLSWWGAAGVTRPVQELVDATREVSAGGLSTRVRVHGQNEIARLAQTFNRMTEQLQENRERLLQAERVTAWREIAHWISQEIKNSLSPLWTSVENLQRSKQQSSADFDRTLGESTGTIANSIDKITKTVGQLNDFADMPRPELVGANLNQIVKSVLKLFEPQFSAVGRPPISPEVHLDENLPPIHADPTLLHRAIENLVMNAIAAMPTGGVLMLRTTHDESSVSLEVSDTGAGLTPEETRHLFTPYYTANHHVAGLGLAIVQSIVSDHGGRISVESETGVGTSFHITLPTNPPKNAELLPADKTLAADKTDAN